MGEIYPGAVTTVVLYGPAFMRDQPEAARRFAVAHLRAQRDYYRAFVTHEGGHEALIQILTKHTAVRDPSLYQRLGIHGVDPNGLVDEAVLNDMQDYFVRIGHQQRRLDLSTVIDRSYVNYALERLGRW